MGKPAIRMKSRLIYPEPLPPAPDAAILALLEKSGIPVKRDDSDALYRKMLLLLDDVDMLYESYMLRLFSDAQIRTGRAFSLAELRSIAQPEADTARFYVQLQNLMDGGVFLRGCMLKCRFCESAVWYGLHELSERLTCRECGAIFQLPLDLNFTFRLNALFAKGLKNGALTVLLMLRYLQKTENVSAWGAGYQVGGVDIDLAALRDGKLIIAECKDAIRARDIPKVKSQLERRIEIARKISAEIFYLAVLTGDIPDEDSLLVNTIADKNIPPFVKILSQIYFLQTFTG